MTMKATLGFAVALFLAMSQAGFAVDAGLVTLPSKYSAQDTIKRFEDAIMAQSKQGWMIFAELDHAAAAEKNGLKLRARTVIAFGNPRLGTANMQKEPTLAIDLPPRALVWEDDQGKVWLSYNSGDYLRGYIYVRHGIAAPPVMAEGFNDFLREIARQATE